MIRIKSELRLVIIKMFHIYPCDQEVVMFFKEFFYKSFVEI